MKPQTLLAVIAASINLTACAKEIPLAEIPAMSDNVLCHTYYQLLTPESESAILSEIGERSIDCSPHHRKCLSYGLKKGSKEYTDCRMKLESIASEERQLKQLTDTLEDMQKKQIEQQKRQQRAPLPVPRSPYQY